MLRNALGSMTVIGTTKGLLSLAVVFVWHSGRILGQRNSPLGGDVVVVDLILVVVTEEVVVGVVVTTVSVCTSAFFSFAVVVSVEGIFVDVAAGAFRRYK